MTSAEIRQAFIEFFASKDHTFVPSAPVFPQDDPTLLFNNAGMNQFKDVFLGTGYRRYSRAVNSQKCIRVSGKHNDLEEVGPSPIHHTFFEMLGNWSFGDYYKPDAIQWAWELFTDVFKLDKSRLYVTVYKSDDSAHRLWEKETDIDPSHISRHGEKDNFWEMGEVGPCGPCSEIHYDLGKPLAGRVSPPDDGPNTDSGRFIELWNLVFIQYYRNKDGELKPLPARHVDTGAGLERIARVMQDVPSNYDTDLFQPIIRAIEEISGIPYNAEEGTIAHRVIADHLRSLSFAIADGAVPGNEGRGYVLRRILRRAARFSRELDVREPILHELVPVLADVMGDHFVELKDRSQHIQHVLKSEEESFNRTLDRGIEHFEIIRKKLVGSGTEKQHKAENTVISGENAFRLYDTYGFPLDLTELMARESDLTVDVDGFNEAMEAARAKSREASAFVATEKEFETITKGDHSEFTGYTKLKNRTMIRKARLVKGQWEDANNMEAEEKPVFELVFAKTPFYAESGGQVADIGIVKGKSLHLEVVDVYDEGDMRIHICRAKRLPEDKEWPGEIEVAVDEHRRTRILPHHTTTHLLQAALRKLLGKHVTQAGSRVMPDYMTFDFTHFEKLTDEQMSTAEEMVNRWIREDHPVSAELTSVEDAKNKGAMALFGEKYGEVVRLVSVGEKTEHGGHWVSRELCGGTHVSRTGEIGLFRIESETAVSAGIRRVICTAGEAAYEKVTGERNVLEKITDLLGSYGSDPSEKLEKLLERQKAMEKEIDRLKKAALEGAVRFVEDWGEEIDFGDSKITVVSGIYGAATDRDGLQSAGDKIIEDLNKAGKEGIGLIGAQVDETFLFVGVATQALVKQKVHVGRIVGAFAKKTGGGGGGKPNFATAGSKDIERSSALLNNKSEVIKFISSQLNALKG